MLTGLGLVLGRPDHAQGRTGGERVGMGTGMLTVLVLVLGRPDCARGVGVRTGMLAGLVPFDAADAGLGSSCVASSAEAQCKAAPMSQVGL